MVFAYLYFLSRWKICLVTQNECYVFLKELPLSVLLRVGVFLLLL